MNVSSYIGRRLGRTRWAFQVVAWSVGLAFCCDLCLEGRTEGTLTEYQVKALFLLKFVNYVDWPPEAFAGGDTPITICVCGESKLGESLKTAVAGMGVGTRAIVIHQIAAADDFRSCHILFISDSESARMRAILEKAGASPILTVGEGAAFAQNGGMINFLLKNGNVRLEIDLAAARKAGLTISSRLLAVADVVKGKAN